MTRTQLQEMTDRDLVDYAQRMTWGHPLDVATMVGQELTARLKARVDDDYPFNTEENL